MIFEKWHILNKIMCMEQFIKFIEKNSSFIISLGIPLGLLFPQFSIFKPYLTPLLILILFFTFLRIDIKDILVVTKRIRLVSAVVIVDLLMIPMFVFAVFKILKVENYILTAFLLFSSVPGGVASASITDILDGDTLFSTAIIILTHIFAPITVPSLFYILLRRVIKIDYLNTAITLVKLIFIPLLMGEISKKVLKNTIEKISSKSKVITTTLILLLGAIVTAVNYNYIMAHPLNALKLTLISIPIYMFFLVFTFYLFRDASLKERISISTTKTFMNATIAVVLAINFLDTKSSLVLTLAQIPWSLMVFPAQIFVRLNKNTPGVSGGK